ncbi:MAG: sugar phosphate isomerase/epimerase [Sedimentisphaerales bacterium]|nr:sugar phosphate isomerase/epimerase [Sedimentisphaerales bacterium]
MAAKEQNRRRFLQLAGISALASLTSGNTSVAQAGGTTGGTNMNVKFKLGLASYTLRKFNLDDTLKMANRLGLKYIALKDFHLPMDSTPEQIKEVAEKVKDAGIELYGGGVIYMTNEREVNRAFDYAKTAGMKVIIGVPNHELLPLVNKKVQEYDIKVAIHNHGPGDRNYPTPTSAYEKVKDLDPRMGLCNDVGHTQRAGVDPSVPTENFVARLLDVHIKDVTEATRRGSTVEVGRGVIDIPKFLRTLVKINYAGIVSFEHEKDPGDPLAGLAESVGYVRGAMAAI